MGFLESLGNVVILATTALVILGAIFLAKKIKNIK